jgi:succinate-semialdehyde dehydrogenase/glutarate-semialdehyde dehydrogenase
MKNPFIHSQAFINGSWLDAEQRFTVSNPCNGKALGEVADLEASQIDSAIDAAEQSLKEWRNLTAKQRSEYLKRWHQLILDNSDNLAALITLEQGKPLAEAKAEINYGASFIEWFAEEAKRAYGETIPTHSPDKRLLTIKQPIGVVAAITPWNFPMAMITRKVAPALAAGCTVVVKPSEETPLSALALAELAQQAGLPAGILNIITCTDAEAAGKQLCEDPRIRKLSFTGSTRVGKLLAAQCAGTLKKLSLELGGNAPFIVFDDADLDQAVTGLIASKFRNSGQTCVSSNRVLVQTNIYDAFLEQLQAAMQSIKPGDGFAQGSTNGPLINCAAINKVQGLIDDAQQSGARVHSIGDELPGEQFMLPTLVTGVTEQMAIFNTEIFGPVVSICRFNSEQQAIEMANNTPYGLAAYFYARDIGRVWRVSEQLEYGMVGVNEGILSTEVAPFGGVKESGMGREGSKHGLDEYLELKYLCIGGID